MDLFAYRAAYPAAPGFKDRDTARDAAGHAARSAELMRARCLALLHGEPHTADEIASALDLSVLSIRPRISELATTGRVIDSGDRRKNMSGRSAIVWKLP